MESSASTRPTKFCQACGASIDTVAEIRREHGRQGPPMDVKP